jgi:hypothetical protein
VIKHQCWTIPQESIILLKDSHVIWLGWQQMGILRVQMYNLALFLMYILQEVLPLACEWVIVDERQPSNISALPWREQVNIQWDDDEVRFELDQHANWNNCPRIDMSHHSHTLSWFRANQSLLILLNAVCLAE